MRFITAKSLRTEASSIWSELPKDQELVITLNGKPVAIMTATNDKDFENSLRAIRRARAIEAVASMQEASVKSGRDRIADEEIETEIKKARSNRS